MGGSEYDPYLMTSGLLYNRFHRFTKCDPIVILAAESLAVSAQGTLVKVHYIRPHAFSRSDVAADDGSVAPRLIVFRKLTCCDAEFVFEHGTKLSLKVVGLPLPALLRAVRIDGSMFQIA